MNFNLQLVNLTDNTVLAETGNTVYRALPSTTIGDLSENTLHGTQEVFLNFTAGASDAGDQLGIRITENANSASRDVLLDRISATSVPEPSSTALLGLGSLALVLRRTRK